MENMESFVRTSAMAFRNRADALAQRAITEIEQGQYLAAASAISEAIRYDGIAKEYEFIVESYDIMEDA